VTASTSDVTRAGGRAGGSTQVGVRELRSKLSDLVRRAGAGERLVITIGGRPVAQLGPLASPDAAPRFDDLIAAGLVDPPTHPGPERDRDTLDLPVDAGPSRVLADLRGAR